MGAREGSEGRGSKSAILARGPAAVGTVVGPRCLGDSVTHKRAQWRQGQKYSDHQLCPWPWMDRTNRAKLSPHIHTHPQKFLVKDALTLTR